MTTDYTYRPIETFNKLRAVIQFVTAKAVENILRTQYRVLKPIGLENMDKEKKYVIASNHLSNFDPFFVASQLKKPIAYMAKKELFEPFFSRMVMNWCGAFAVDRDNVNVSTIKTALSIKKTTWHFGIFPQGTRSQDTVLKATKGFASIAKKMGREILPVGIVRKENKNRFFKKQDFYLNVGKPISTEGTVEEIYDAWCKAIASLTDLQYNPS